MSSKTGFSHSIVPHITFTGAFDLHNRAGFRYLQSFALSPVPSMPAIEIITPSRTYHLIGESYVPQSNYLVSCCQGGGAEGVGVGHPARHRLCAGQAARGEHTSHIIGCSCCTILRISIAQPVSAQHTRACRSAMCLSYFRVALCDPCLPVCQPYRLVWCLVC
jgi:hypothetical protein